MAVDGAHEREPLLWSPVTAAAFADGVLAGVPVIQAISRIDPLVLRAIESSTADHLHSFPSVHSYVHDHFFAAPTLSADGWFERLTGYVAEQKAAAALEAAGHHVTFAATANQPVWDLLVDGHPVQVKEGISGVKSYLLEHHGIPVVTGHEVAVAVKDPMVHGIVGLGSPEIHEAAHKALHGIDDALNPGFHFPLITLAFATYREAKLLIHERTTFAKALKHVGLDVAGVGAGAFGGAKAGAFAGAWLGPIGAAIGGLVGAVAGGVGGKVLSTSIRRAPFEQARAAYEEVVDGAELALSTAVERSQIEVRQLQSRYETRFAEKRNFIALTTAHEVSRIAQSYDSTFLRFAETFTVHLDQLTLNLRQQERLVLSTVPGTGFKRFVLPSGNDHLRSAISMWFRKARQTIRTEKRRFNRLRPRTGEVLRQEIERFFESYVFELETLDIALRTLVHEFCESERRARQCVARASTELQEERDGLIRAFSRDVERLHASLTDLIRSWNKKVASSRDQLQIEARAIGIDL